MIGWLNLGSLLVCEGSQQEKVIQTTAMKRKTGTTLGIHGVINHR